MTKLAMVFPGQGSQAVGMLKGYDGLPEIASVVDKAAQVLGVDFVKLMDHGPAEALNQTVIRRGFSSASGGGGVGSGNLHCLGARLQASSSFKTAMASSMRDSSAQVRNRRSRSAL